MQSLYPLPVNGFIAKHNLSRACLGIGLIATLACVLGLSNSSPPGVSLVGRSTETPKRITPTSYREDPKLEAKNSSQQTYAIVIHGGAGGDPGNFEDKFNATRHAALEEALTLGEKVLANGGQSIDAVEKVIRFLEDHPQFNAGRGAVFTDQGRFELDASIMLGDHLACGAVASVTTVQHPISLARAVMEKTKHVLLVSEGAQEFAKLQDLEIVENDYFWTPEKKKLWQRWKERQGRVGQVQPGDSGEVVEPPLETRLASNGKWVDIFSGPDFGASYRGTVGCVALDQNGNICAGTSTGGMLGKRYGRVGDSPIVGAGTYADDRYCGISCTGTGEQYIRNAIAYQVVARMRFADESLDSAVDNVLNELNKGDGGLIGIDHKGNVVAKWNTAAMAHAYRNANGERKVVWDPNAKEDKPIGLGE